MYRIAIQKSTGKIIEHQSGESELGTLTQNALTSGYDEADVEEKYISQEDYQVLAEAERIASLTYAEKRAQEYPPLQEQADMQYWDSVNGTTTWQDAIALVKLTYPKGGR